MNHCTPGLSVLHHLPEFAQTHVHWVSDAIQPSRPLSHPSSPALDLSQHQGLFKWVKQEMARVNINILGISELKWTVTGEFNADDHYIYYCGQESLRRNGVAIIVNKRVWNALLWVQSEKQQNDLHSFPRQTIQYHSNSSLGPNH